MELMIPVIAITAILSLLPFFLNWLRTARCPKCGHWFCLEFHSFIVTDKVTGHNRTRHGGGHRSGWRGGGYYGSSHTSDDPFIREWGEARYICRACGRHVSFHNVKRDR